MKLYAVFAALSLAPSLAFAGPVNIGAPASNVVLIDPATGNGYAASGGGGGGAVYGPTANGSPAANPPVLAGGTADGTATGTVQNAKVDSSGNQYAVVSSSALPTGAATSANQTTGNTSLATIATNTGAATPAGTNIIGKVGIDQTTPGTTNGVQVNAALPAGANLIGKTGIDQTTPGTTNGVQVNAALPAGTNLIGKMGIDQTTPGTTNGVQVNAALPAGTNLIGKTGIDQTTPGTTNAVQPIPGTTGGTTQFTLTAANTTNATNIKGTAGQVYHVSAYNNSATLAWISFYNNSGTPTCGSSIIRQVMIPANSTSGAGAVEDFSIGEAFGTGIAICVTTGIAGTGAVAASTYVINVDYK